MDYKKFLSQTRDRLESSILINIGVSISLFFVTVIYTYFAIFSTDSVTELINQTAFQLISQAYVTSSIHMKIALVVFSTLFLTSQMHTLIYTFSESYDSELNKLELIKKFNLTSLNALSTITVSILASLFIYYGLTQTLPSLGMNLTPNIVSGIISLSLFCGIYISEFYLWEKNRSMFTSVMLFLIPDGINVYENSLNKNLFLLGLLFTQNGGISHIRSWGSGIVISYKYDQKMLVFAFSSRADFDDWCVDADEVSSSCSICGEVDGKCLKLDKKGFVAGSESEDTDVLCTCKDCKDDILKAGVNSGDIDEEDISKNRI